MIRLRFLFSIAAAAILATACQAQQVKDLSTLFPPNSLLYFEVVKPAEISRECMSMVKGTILENMIPYMAKWHEKDPVGGFGDRQGIGMASMFASPEFLAEAGRLQGAAFAIVGLNKKQEPEMVFVLLSGESNFPGIMLRTILAELDTRIAAEVEGTPIFGFKPMMFRQVAAGAVANPAAPGAPPAPPPPPPPLEAPFIAKIPGAIIMGGNTDSVSDVVRRIKSKEKSPSLSDHPEFKESSSLRRKPGLFAYVNPVRGLDAIAKADPKALKEQEPRWAMEMLNPKAFRSVAAHLALSEGTLDFQVGAQLEPSQSSPILDLIADQRVSLPIFQPVPKDSTVAFSFALKDGEKRWSQILTAADAIVGADGPKPSDQIHAIEEKLKVSIGKEIFGRIAAVTVALPEKQELPKGAMEIPMIFVTGNDPGATEQLEKLVAPILSMVAGETVDPITQTIDGIKIRSVSGAHFQWKAPLHFGRSGTTLAIGLDRKLVASSLSGKIGTSLLGDPKLADVIKEHDRAALVGMWRWAGLLPEGIAEMTDAPQWGPNGRIAPNPAMIHDKAEKLRQSMQGLIHDMPPLVVSLRREDRQVLLHVQQRQSPGSIPKLIEDFADAIMRGATNNFGAAPAAPAPIKN